MFAVVFKKSTQICKPVFAKLCEILLVFENASFVHLGKIAKYSFFCLMDE